MKMEAKMNLILFIIRILQQEMSGIRECRSIFGQVRKHWLN
jgi:hypothetical protein